MMDFADMEEGLSRLPERMRGEMRRYIVEGVLPGPFVTAAVSNDLCGVFEHGDDENILALMHYLRFLKNHAPPQAWGSVDKVQAWQQLGGWKALERPSSP